MTVPIRKWWDRARQVAGAPGTRGLEVTADEWKQAAGDVAASGGRLLSLWASGMAESQPSAAESPLNTAIFAAYWIDAGLLLTELPVPQRSGTPAYPGIEALFPAASRMQRATFDLTGVRSSDPDQRPWLHQPGATYEFVRVEGDGVHEIAVGPVHAGTIEPGHFRFSVVGEKVLRLEEHLGYVHKGIERRFSELATLDGHRLAARVSGDSAVAFAWAYCQAVEGMAGCAVPQRAHRLRALFLELERIANHLGDLGALGSDAGFAFGLVQFSRLKEQLLRALDRVVGQRYLLDAIVPGGVRADVTAQGLEMLVATLADIAQECAALRGIYEDHTGVRDRFTGTGRLEPALAARLGVLGLAARASGQPLDARVDLPCKPYDELLPVKIVRSEGDVAARVAVRFDEVQESCRLVRQIYGVLPKGPYTTVIDSPPPGSFGVGFIEGWRGPVFLALEAGSAGLIRRCHPHDSSWQCWPAIEQAIIGNIVPDFPLINKSFNLSYSGVDL